MKTDESARDPRVPLHPKYSRRELNNMYREIPLKDTTFRMLRKYLQASANLYGIVTLKKVYEIISEQNPGLVSKEAFLAFIRIAKHEDDDYVILSEDDVLHNGNYTPPLLQEVVDRTLFLPDSSDYFRQKERQSGKPYYVPRKRIFLQYSDPLYFESTAELAALEQFLENTFGMSKDTESPILWDILYGVRYLGATLSEVLAYLNGKGIVFPSKRSGEEFCRLYMAFHNQARMQCHRGHTPNEIHLRFPEKDKNPGVTTHMGDPAVSLMNANARRNEVFTLDLPDESVRASLEKQITSDTSTLPISRSGKPGRNDPCPCGSGKKYKKCCGRNSR